jgi:hypothetical protein
MSVKVGESIQQYSFRYFFISVDTVYLDRQLTCRYLIVYAVCFCVAGKQISKSMDNEDDDAESDEDEVEIDDDEEIPESDSETNMKQQAIIKNQEKPKRSNRNSPSNATIQNGVSKSKNPKSGSVPMKKTSPKINLKKPTTKSPKRLGTKKQSPKPSRNNRRK